MALQREELDPNDAATRTGGVRIPTPRTRHVGQVERVEGFRNDGVGTISAFPARAQRRVESARRRSALVVEGCLVLTADAVLQSALVLLTGRALGPLALVTSLGAMCAWTLAGLYRRRIALSVLDDLPALAVGVLFGLAGAITVSGAVWAQPVAAREVLLVGGGALALAVAGRWLAYATILHERVHGRFGRRAVMIGAGSHARSLHERIAAHPEAGIHLVGTVANQLSRSTEPLPTLGPPGELAQVLRTFDITDVVIGYGGMSSTDLVDVLRTCDRANTEIFMVPRLFELYTLRRGDDHIWSLPLIRVRRPAQRSVTWRVKRSFDIGVAAVGLLCAAPVMLLVALGVRMELGSGLIFRQTRIGLNGKPFELLKFRSVQSTPVAGAGAWTPVDGQLGPVGRFIRRYSLDELPQLYNVLRGDMSLVGPRPERPEYVEQFCATFPRYVHRHRVPVGMTGLAAVNGLRGDTSIEERAHFDNWYIDNWSLWLDIKIMLRTLDAVLRGTGG